MVVLPNIRKMFVPDYGCTIAEADLSGADAQVVAWEADDTSLKNAFKQGIKIHRYNARTMFEQETKDMEDVEVDNSPYYKAVKRGVHATNYGASIPTLATNCGWSKAEASKFQSKWFALHPQIPEWHQRVERYLTGLQCWNCDNLDIILDKPCSECGAQLGSTIKNRFGFRRIYFDRVDGGLVPQALAWVPQSTVNFCVELGWISISEGPEYLMQFSHSELVLKKWKEWLVNPVAYEKWKDIVEFKLQVHDSIVFQVPFAYEHKIPEIAKDMLVRVPYADPLVIPSTVKMSRKSWGDCE